MVTQQPSWVAQAFPFYELIRSLHYYLDLECWIVSVGDWREWYLIRHHDRESWVIDFDELYGKSEGRVRFNNVHFEKVLREKKTVCGDWNGAYSFFVPVLRDGEVLGILQSGVFLRAKPDRISLLRQWKYLTGREPAGFNPDFHRYVRAMLETPLAEGPVFTALKELLELFASALAGVGDRVEVSRRAAEIRVNVFSKHLPHRIRAERVLKLRRARTQDWWSLKPGGMTHEGAQHGRESMPVMALALVIDDPTVKGRDELDWILRDYLFQREIFKYTLDFPYLLAGPLEDYRVMLYISHGQGWSRARTKLWVLDSLDQLAKHLSAKLGVKILAGVSRYVQQGEALLWASKEAVTALESCRLLNRPILFYEDIRANPTIPIPPSFYDLSKELVDHYVQGVMRDLDRVRNRYVERILFLSSGRPEVLRLHFLYAFGSIADVLRKRNPAQSVGIRDLFEMMERRMQETGEVSELLAVFQESLKRLLGLSLRPSEGGFVLRLEAARRYVDENFNQDLRLSDVAKLNGFSVSVFSRGFKKTAGMGFSAHLRMRRLEKVNELLGTTSLPIVQVSLECGFNNLQYFYDVFKRSVGCTPSEYRGRSSRAAR
jgi:AraC-like DNA-binding protein